MPDLSSQIQSTASGPKSVQTDAGTVTAQSIQDQIEADKYLAAKAAMSRNGSGIKLTKLIKGGQTGDVGLGQEV